MVSSHVQGIYSILVKQTEQRNSVAISWFNVKFHWAATNEILSIKYFLPDSTAYWLGGGEGTATRSLSFKVSSRLYGLVVVKVVLPH